MVSDDVFEPSPCRSDLENVDQKLGKLISSASDFLRQLPLPGLGREKGRQEHSDHRNARARRDDDSFFVSESRNEMNRHLSGLSMVAGVEGGLATTGLSRIELNLQSEPLQDFHRFESDLRVELIDQACDE